MESSNSEQDRLIVDSVARFLDREVRPHVHALEHDDIYPQDIVAGMKALGLFGATIGAEYGGLGLSASTYAKIVETVSTVWMSLSSRSDIRDAAVGTTMAASSIEVASAHRV